MIDGHRKKKTFIKKIISIKFWIFFPPKADLPLAEKTKISFMKKTALFGLKPPSLAMIKTEFWSPVTDFRLIFWLTAAIIWKLKSVVLAGKSPFGGLTITAMSNAFKQRRKLSALKIPKLLLLKRFG